MLEADLFRRHEECLSFILKIDRKRNTPFFLRHILIETGKLSHRIESKNAARGDHRFIIKEPESAVVYRSRNGIIHCCFMHQFQSVVICFIYFQRIVILINIDDAVMYRFDLKIKHQTG